MTSPLKGPIAKTVTAALKATMYPLVYQRIASSYNPTTGGTTTTTTPYDCIGFVDQYTTAEVAWSNAKILATDRKAIVLANTLKLTGDPATTDKLIANGEVLKVIGFERDPAGATLIIQARKA